MKFLIARFNHETNTFSPVPTPLSAFAPDYDAQAYRANDGMRTAMAAFIDAARSLGAECVTPVSAMANPSGRVHADAYADLTDRIVAAAKAEIEQEVARAKEQLRDAVADLAVAGASKILQKDVDTKTHAELLAQLKRQL